MKIRATRGYIVKLPFDVFHISKEIECDVIPVQGMMFTDAGLVNEEGIITSVEIDKVTISPEENKYFIELKQDSQYFDRVILEQNLEQWKPMDGNIKKNYFKNKMPSERRHYLNV